jgi:hypothetical protein
LTLIRQGKLEALNQLLRLLKVHQNVVLGPGGAGGDVAGSTLCSGIVSGFDVGDDETLNSIDELCDVTSANQSSHVSRGQCMSHIVYFFSPMKGARGGVAIAAAGYSHDG